MANPAEFVPLAPTIPGPDPDTRRPRTAFPPGSCDCHVHIFGPQQRYPYTPDRGYVPNEASLDDLARMLKVIGCDRAVIVHPSVYGTDNRCTLDALRAGRMPLRGVAVIDDNTPDAELEALHEAGVRGIRMNLKAATLAASMELAQRLAKRIGPRGWHIQFFFYADTMPKLEVELAKLPVDVVIDHLGYISAANGLGAPGFQMLLRLARQGRSWFKLSAPYRQSKQRPNFPDVAPFAQALLAEAADRCVWGSDWPHASRNDTGILDIPNDGDLADVLGAMVPDAAQRKAVLVDNPARLYGF